jgi:hypothetical protein
MIALDPEAHAGDEEARDLSSSVIIDISAPIAVKSLSGIGMLVEVGVVEFAKSIWSFGKCAGTQSREWPPCSCWHVAAIRLRPSCWIRRCEYED